MKDEGVQRAIEAAGGVSALARAIGVAQPSVSNWTRIPSDRVVSVEKATGVPRHLLRPDLYAEDIGDVTTPSAPIDEVDLARAQFYRLLASLLRRAPDEDMLDRLRRTTGDSTEIGVALLALSHEAESARVETVASEFFGLFIGVGRGDLLPYASFYLSGFLHERPLARVREDLARLGIERVEGDFEPEDHVATLFDVMAGLADGTFQSEADAQAAFFERHLKPWIGRFFLDLEMAERSKFYRAVGQLGRVFTGIEIEAFGIGA